MNVLQKRINVTPQPQHVLTILVICLVTIVLVSMDFLKLTKMTRHVTT